MNLSLNHARGPRVDSVALVYLCLGVLGIGARFLLAHKSAGSNDIFGWEAFGSHISTQGVLYQYLHDPWFNHPPLMGYLAQFVHAISEWTGVRFSLLFKLPTIAADACAAIILGQIWRERRGFRTGALAFALYGLSPISMLLSAHHGNTDCLCSTLILASVFVSERRSLRFASFRFVAGLLLGAAINVKLIAVLCVPALLFSGGKSRRARLHFLGGLALGAVPFIPVLLTVGADFYRNAIAYNSNRDNWGIIFLLRQLATMPKIGPTFELAQSGYATLGRYLILLAAALVGVLAAVKRRPNGYQLVALAMALFLVLAPGFGIQYLIYACPLIYAVSLSAGFLSACLSGLFAGTVYLLFWDGSVPWVTLFTAPFLPETRAFGVLAWAALFFFVVEQLRRSFARA